SVSGGGARSAAAPGSPGRPDFFHTIFRTFPARTRNLSYPRLIIEHMFVTTSVEALESAIGELAAKDPKRWPDEDLERGILALQRVIDRLSVERLRLIAEMNRRKTFARDGHVSASAWLAERNRTTFGAAKRDVAMAAALEEMPATRVALSRGEVSAAAAEMLV